MADVTPDFLALLGQVGRLANRLQRIEERGPAI